MLGPAGRTRGDFPWWLVVAGVIALALFYRVLSDDLHAQILTTLLRGVQITIFVTLVAFGLAALLGLGIALMSLSRWLVVRQVARFYTEVVRGVPMLVLLLYVAFGSLRVWSNCATGSWVFLESSRSGHGNSHCSGARS